jgi:quinoprotein glucose dehydrogenase
VTIIQVCKNDFKEPRIDTDYRFYCEGVVETPKTALGSIPIVKPPYGELVAINLNKGEIAWRMPFGEGSATIRRSALLKGVTLPERLGSPSNNGVIVTKGGLVFAGSSDSHLYAFDKATGREVSRVATPFPVEATPMTYRARSGRQFVIVATGAGPDATLVAFALRPPSTPAVPQ